MPFCKFLVIAFCLCASVAYSQADLTEKLKQHSNPIALHPDSSNYGDLAFLKPLLAGKRLVSAGEVTHGTREFHLVRHRLFQYLVKEMGYKIFAFEADFSDCVAVNEYIVQGRGNLNEAMKYLSWTDKTEEVKTTLEWIKNYNAGLGDDQKVKFYGFDLQSSYASAVALEDYFKKVDASFAADLRLNTATYQGERRFFTVKKTLIDSIKKQLIAQKAIYTQNGNLETREWEMAMQHLTILRQHNEMGSGAIRDEYMAENIRWILNYEGQDSKMMIWAHNSHINIQGSFTNAASMGSVLKEFYKDQLYTIGLDCKGGKFAAIDMMASLTNSKTTIVEFGFEAPPKGSFTEQAARTGVPAFFLDMKQTDPALAKWLGTPLITRLIFGIYIPGDYHFVKLVLPRCYDGIIFINQTTPIVPLK